MDRVRLVAHKGRMIVLLDVSGCPAPEVARVLVEGRSLIARQAPRTALTLTDVTGALFDDDATKAAQENAKLNAPYVRAAALVGVTGLKRIVYTAITRVTGRDYKVFDTREQAMDWLAQQV